MGSSAGPISAAALATTLATTVLVTPLGEEVLFRGFLYPVIRLRIGPRAAILATALIFASFHLSVAPVPFTQFIGGIVFALAYERTRNLWSAIVLYALGNRAIAIIEAVVPHLHVS